MIVKYSTNKNTVLISVIISSIILTGIFHKQALGLNLAFFESLLFTWLWVTKQFQLRNRTQITLSVLLLFSSCCTVLAHSTFSYIINFIVLYLFIGLIIYPETKSLINAFRLSLASTFKAQKQFIKSLSGLNFKGQKLGSIIWKFRIFFLPVGIIILFVFIYSKSNPIFNDTLVHVSEYIQNILNAIFSNFDFSILVSFLICLFLSIFFLIRISNERIIKIDLQAREYLKRTKINRNTNFKTNALKNEYKAGVFLLLALNLLILIVNVIDVNWVWFNFEWKGQYLKQFVHEGTYLLILSIFISIALVLHLFRGNINFFHNNKLLQLLSYFWLAQNAILTLSVAIRNFWYIKHFALAYKRIGVIIFLLLVLYGLFTVLIKVLKKKSSFYLFKTNAMALVIVLSISSAFNWDSIIARYNFRKSDRAFLHLNYLVTLSNKSLPFLDKTLSELSRIEEIQKENFPFEQKYMDSGQYYTIIEKRKIEFKNIWESKNLLSWNLPEYLAYRRLFK